MRRPTPSLLAIIVFWASYVPIAAYVLYEVTPPVSRALLLILGGYAAILGVLTFVLLRRGRRGPPDRDLRG